MAQNLVVLYDVRYVMEPVYGHVGGGGPRELMPPIVSTCFASIVFACPACESTVVGGQLICLACHAIFLFRGQDRYYSPILNEFCYARGEPDPYQEN